MWNHPEDEEKIIVMFLFETAVLDILIFSTEHYILFPGLISICIDVT